MKAFFFLYVTFAAGLLATLAYPVEENWEPRDRRELSDDENLEEPMVIFKRSFDDEDLNEEDQLRYRRDLEGELEELNEDDNLRFRRDDEEHQFDDEDLLRFRRDDDEVSDFNEEDILRFRRADDDKKKNDTKAPPNKRSLSEFNEDDLNKRDDDSSDLNEEDVLRLRRAVDPKNITATSMPKPPFDPKNITSISTPKPPKVRRSLNEEEAEEAFDNNLDSDDAMQKRSADFSDDAEEMEKRSSGSKYNIVHHHSMHERSPELDDNAEEMDKRSSDDELNEMELNALFGYN